MDRDGHRPELWERRVREGLGVPFRKSLANSEADDDDRGDPWSTLTGGS